MSAVGWEAEFPEPWRRIGREFAEMLPALIGEPAALQPPPPPLNHPDGPESTFGWLARGREALGLSQRALARRLRCSQSRISLLERGMLSLRPDERERLTAILLPAATTER